MPKGPSAIDENIATGFRVHTKRIQRHVNGVLLLNKPAGYTSNHVLQRVKRLFMATKAGHTGNLDPFATGLLPICLGEATKFSHHLLDADKSYRAVLKLGTMTSTGDTEGEVISTKATDHLAFSDVEKVVSAFQGEISQTPPMHSALKYQGRPLYTYARQGLDVARKPRMVTIHAIRLQKLRGDIAEIVVVCSKGTYIRVLAEDIGKDLGCGAHLVELERLSIAEFDLQNAYTLEQLTEMTEDERDQCLLPVDALLAHLPEIDLDEERAMFFCQGQAIWKSGIRPMGLLRVYKKDRHFIGLGEVLGDGRVAPRRLVKFEH